MEYENTRTEFDDRPGRTLSLDDEFKRHLEHELECLSLDSDTYIPGKPCPVCGYTCQFPEKHARCCKCNPTDYS